MADPTSPEELYRMAAEAKRRTTENRAAIQRGNPELDKLLDGPLADLVRRPLPGRPDPTSPHGTFRAPGQLPQMSRDDPTGPVGGPMEEPPPESYPEDFGMQVEPSQAGVEPQRGLPQSDIVDLQNWLTDRDRNKRQADARAMALQAENPEQAAKDQTLADKHGVQPVQVQSDRSTYQALDIAKTMDDLEKTAPKTRAWFQDPRNFEVAHDDAKNLSWWENPSRWLMDTLPKVGQAVTAAVPATGAALAGWVQKQAETPYGASQPGDLTFNFTLDKGKVRDFKAGVDLEGGHGGVKLTDAVKFQTPDGKDAIAEWSKAAISQAKAAMPETHDIFQSALVSAFHSMALQSPGLVAGIITRNPATALGLMDLQQQGTVYGEDRALGISPEKSRVDAEFQGHVEAGTELAPTHFLFSEKTLLGKWLKSTIAEVPGELAATALENASEQATQHPELTLGDYLKKLGPDEGQTLLATVFQSVLTAGLAHGGIKTMDVVQAKQRADQSDQLGRVYEAVGNQALDSKLGKRIPSKFRDFVAAATKDGPLENVPVNGDAFEATAEALGKTTDELSQAFNLDAAEVRKTIDAGGDVLIPTGNYAAAMHTAKDQIGVDGSVLHGQFTTRGKAIRTAQNEAARQVVEEALAAAKEIESKDQGFADAADRVRQDIREKIHAANRYNPSSIDSYANIFSSMVSVLAERTGQDPEAVWKEHGFDVISSVPGVEMDDSELSQGRARTPRVVEDEMVQRASEKLSSNEFEA